MVALLLTCRREEEKREGREEEKRKGKKSLRQEPQFYVCNWSGRIVLQVFVVFCTVCPIQGYSKFKILEYINYRINAAEFGLLSTTQNPHDINTMNIPSP